MFLRTFQILTLEVSRHLLGPIDGVLQGGFEILLFARRALFLPFQPRPFLSRFRLARESRPFRGRQAGVAGARGRR